MTNQMKTLQARLKMLEVQKHVIEDQMSQVTREMEAIMLASYPHKVGDVIEGRRGQPVKIVKIHASPDDVWPVVVEKLPSGGWSKRERFMINWDRE